MLFTFNKVFGTKYFVLYMWTDPITEILIQESNLQKKKKEKLHESSRIFNQERKPENLHHSLFITKFGIEQKKIYTSKNHGKNIYFA